MIFPALSLVPVRDTMSLVSDPWMFLAERHPDVQVRLLPPAYLGNRWGQTLWRDGVPEIHIAFDLGRIQRRCTLAHELHHVLRGEPCQPLCPDDEADVIEQTARFLLPDLDQVAEAVAGHDLDTAAERLHVTRHVLTDRLDSLTEAELVRFNVLLRELCEHPGIGPVACQHVETRTHRRPRRRRLHDCGQAIRGRAS